MPLKPQLPFRDWLLEQSRSIYKNCDRPERARTQTSVTLRRRFRGNSKSDQLGVFSPLGTYQWLGDRPGDEVYMNLHVLNITKPTVRANQSAMVSARVQVKVEPQTKDLRMKGAAAVGQGIADWLNGHEDHWGDVLENNINQMSQLDGEYFVQVYPEQDPEGCEYSVEEWADQEVPMPGEGVCANCAKSFPLAPEQVQDPEGQVACPYCKGMAEIKQPPQQKALPMPQSKSYRAREMRTREVSTLEIRIDESRSQGGNMRKVQWLEHHYLEAEDDLQSQFEGVDLGTPVEWSFPLKWKYSLETGDDSYLKRWSPGNDANFREFEVRKIYLRPRRYKNYIFPQDFEMKNGKGEVVFSARAGEKLIDKCPRGFYFMLTGEVVLPELEKVDLRDEWSHGCFLPDSASFHGQPCTEIGTLQDDCNNLYTIDIAQRERGSIQTTVFDREWFDLEDFETDLAPTKESLTMEPTDDIRRHFATVPPANITGPMEGTLFILNQLPNVTGVQPPMSGGSTGSNEPYAKYALQRQASLGMLTPSQQSKATCKCAVVKNHLKWAQRERPLEWFNEIQTRYGAEWRQEDIQAFLECDPEKDLKISYTEGSEVPSTLIEREIRFRQFITDLAAVASAMQRPDLITLEMVSKGAEYAGVDLDVGNVEADQRLANSRFEKIKGHLSVMRGNLPGNFPIVQLAMADPDLLPLRKENHQTHIEWYADQERALAAQAVVDREMIQCCETMIERHEQARVTATQLDTADALAAQAPVAAAEALMSGGGEGGAPTGAPAPDPEAEKQAALEERDYQTQESDAKRKHESDEKQKDRDHQLRLETMRQISALSAKESDRPKTQPAK